MEAKQWVAASPGEQPDDLAANGLAAFEFLAAALMNVEDHGQPTGDTGNVG
jgi:hypothetical protein